MNHRDVALATLANVDPEIAREALAYGEWFLGGSYCDEETGRL